MPLGEFQEDLHLGEGLALNVYAPATALATRTLHTRSYRFIRPIRCRKRP